MARAILNLTQFEAAIWAKHNTQTVATAYGPDGKFQVWFKGCKCKNPEENN